MTTPPTQSEDCPSKAISITVHAILSYALTSLIVVFGVLFGHRFVEGPVHAHAPKGTLANAFANHDGGWYKMITTEGYSYNPDKKSPVAFFPLYPLLAHALISVTHFETEAALLLVSHVCLAAAFVLAAFYVRQRSAVSPTGLSEYVLLSMGLMPATLFFRMTYTESLFVLLSIFSLLAMAKRWPLPVVAFIVGLATAARPVGIGMLAPFLLYCWHHSSTRWQFLLKSTFLLPIACWGVAAYAVYQQACFGDPLAFAKTLSHWGRPPVPFTEKLLNLLTYEPIWQVYDAASPFYWKTGWGTEESDLLFSWYALNPIYFLLTVISILIGAAKGWLSSYEVLLALALLLIAYFTRAHEHFMNSQARYAAAVFPVYLVLGNILVRFPISLAGALLAVSAFFLGVFSALFASWYMVF
jgi:hypothetical protein